MSNLYKYENTTVRIKCENGDVFTGACTWYPWEHGRDEFNIAEECLRIGDNMIFENEIRGIEVLRNEACIPVRDWPEAYEEIALWFHEKWHIPLEAYRESISDCLGKDTGIPQWYVVARGNRIIAGCGVIENDFHERKDLTPNVCAVYVEEEYRNQGIAGFMLQYACEDMAAMGVETLYLLTDHTGFYERYGWQFLCMVRGSDGELSRMYVRHTEPGRSQYTEIMQRYEENKKIKAVFFDAFDTLFKVTEGASAETIIQNITADGKSVDEKAFKKEWKAFYKEKTADDHVFMTEREIFISRIRMFYDRYGVDRDAEKDADALLERSRYREVYPEVNTVLDKLRKKYQVFIASNTDDGLLEAVMSNNNVRVDKVYTSEGLKCYKPAERFYRAILSENDLTPQNVLFVGDSVSDDVLGPKALGMRTAWIDRKSTGADHGQDYTISDLEELLQICGIETQV